MNLYNKGIKGKKPFRKGLPAFLFCFCFCHFDGLKIKIVSEIIQMAFHTSVQEELIESTWKLDDPFECSVHCRSIKFQHCLVLPVIELKTLLKPSVFCPCFCLKQEMPNFDRQAYLFCDSCQSCHFTPIRVCPGSLDKGISIWLNS